jgi:hypothetical protein
LFIFSTPVAQTACGRAGGRAVTAKAVIRPAGLAPFTHATLTLRSLNFAAINGQRGIPVMDVIFVLLILGLYAVTHWLIWALSRLGGLE